MGSLNQLTEYVDRCKQQQAKALEAFADEYDGYVTRKQIKAAEHVLENIWQGVREDDGRYLVGVVPVRIECGHHLGPLCFSAIFYRWQKTECFDTDDERYMVAGYERFRQTLNRLIEALHDENEIYPGPVVADENGAVYVVAPPPEYLSTTTIHTLAMIAYNRNDCEGLFSEKPLGTMRVEN